MTARKAWFITITGTLILLGMMGAVELAARVVTGG